MPNLENSKVGDVTRYGKEGYEIRKGSGDSNDCGI